MQAARRLALCALALVAHAAPVPKSADRCAEAGAKTSGDGRMCVCPAKTVCTGSRCHVGHRPGAEAASVSALVHGFRLDGDGICTDCTCFGDDAAPSGSVLGGLHTGALQVARRLASWAAGPTKVQAAAPPGKGMDMFIGIKSAPGTKYHDRRVTWRQSPCAKLYARAGIRYRFIIGTPMSKGHTLTNHNQAGKDTQEERTNAQQLLEEADKYDDIQLVPMRDQYMDINNKLLNLLRFGYYFTDAKYIVEHDDEYCMNLGVARQLIERHDTKAPDAELYAGFLRWQGNEYEQMKGPHGEVAVYMSGWCSFMTRPLVKLIVEDDWHHTFFSSLYGTQMDDANTGKWIAHAKQKHGVKVDLQDNRNLVVEVGKL